MNFTIKAYLAFILLQSGLDGYAQAASSRRSEISFGISQSDPYGELRLVRGTRKIVKTSFEGSLSYQLKIARTLSTNSSVALSVGFANYDYSHQEDFSDGYQNHVKDDFNYMPVLVHYQRTRSLWQSRLELLTGGHAGIVFYSREINLLSELHLLSTPQSEWPSHPESLSPMDLEIHNGFGAGVYMGLRRKILDEKFFVELVSSLSYARFSAAIIDDPEDDGDDDIELKTNPFDVGIHIGYRF